MVEPKRPASPDDRPDEIEVRPAKRPSKPKKAPARAKAKPRKAKAAKAKASKAPGAGADAPIRNYDQLTAKDVVARVQRLSGPQATAVLDYERARKKRATVIRAAQKRLAAAS